MSRSKREEDRAESGPGADDHGKPSFAQQAWEQVSTLAIAVAIALTIRACVVEPFRIPSGSMLPTLLIGDHLFVNKFVYGVRIPFTDERLPGLREPERGDVVVFEVARSTDGRIIPADRRPDLPTEDFVKRIVGLPGDRVEVRRDQLFVNGELVVKIPQEEPFMNERGKPLVQYQENLGECAHAVLDDPDRLGLPQSPFTVEPGRYLMMGDNRDNSNDSRSWGTVRKEEFKGPAFILYWSWDNAGSSFLDLMNPYKWLTVEKRWGRVFQRVKCEPVDGSLGPATGG